MKPAFFFKQLLKLAVQNIILPFCYMTASGKDVDEKLVVFADAHHDSLPDSMEMFFHYLKKETDEGRKDLKIEEFFRDFSKMSASETLKSSVSFMKLYARARCIILCDNFLPVSSCKKRKETKVIQLWHGPGAFKKFGYDTPDDIPSFYKSNVFANYDLVTVSGHRAIAPFQSAMRQPDGVVKDLGIPRMDRWYDEAYLEGLREKFVSAYPEAKGKKVLLWAPTFRGNAGVPSLAGLSDVERLAEKLKDEWYVIISLHPHLLSLPEYKRYSQPLRSQEIMPSADVIMTDYSSILYDAVVLKKRLLIFAPDACEFLDKRGVYMSMDEIPAVRVDDPEKMEQALKDTFDNYDYDIQRAFFSSWLSSCDGNVCERIGRYI